MKIAGVDEVGIGCLAGPLISAAVIFGKINQNIFLKIQKKLLKRTELYKLVT